LCKKGEIYSSFCGKIRPAAEIKLDFLSYFDNVFLENEIKDSQLRMIFTCCNPALSAESQITLTLKTLCGLIYGKLPVPC